LVVGPNIQDLRLDWSRHLSDGAWNTDAIALVAAQVQEILKNHRDIEFDEEAMSIEVLIKTIRSKLRRTANAVRQLESLMTSSNPAVSEVSIKTKTMASLKKERAYGRQHGVCFIPYF
jgi:hypothetical protein